MVNGKEPTRFEDHDLTHDQAHQAQVFMRVLKGQGHSVHQMSNILSEMGRLLLVHSQEVSKPAGEA